MFKKLLVIFLISFCIFSVFGCSAPAEQNGYDGREYDISSSGDGRASLTESKIGNDYSLTVSGSGRVVDYTNKEEVPWNVITKRVTSVIIEDGVTNIGDYFFSATKLSEFILPSSVEKIGENSFPKGAVIYSYAEAEFDEDYGYEIYYYSAEKPYAMNKYFRLVDGVPRVWREYSVLFIGNSFTFRQGTEENPMVPYLFGKLADSFGEIVVVDFVVKSSYTLTKYADPKDEKGAVVEQKLTSSQYDYIVLQEQSTKPVTDYNGFKTAVGKLTKRIGETQEKAEVFLYATWGYEGNNGLKNTSSKDIAEMNSKLKAAYDNCGAEYGLKVTHVGDAFLDIYTNHSEIQLYSASDNFHQSNIGAYLSACCHLTAMLGVDVRNTTFSGDEFSGNFDETLCEILRETAYSVSFVR